MFKSIITLFFTMTLNSYGFDLNMEKAIQVSKTLINNNKTLKDLPYNRKECFGNLSLHINDNRKGRSRLNFRFKLVSTKECGNTEYINLGTSGKLKNFKPTKKEKISVTQIQRFLEDYEPDLVNLNEVRFYRRGKTPFAVDYFKDKWMRFYLVRNDAKTMLLFKGIKDPNFKGAIHFKTRHGGSFSISKFYIQRGDNQKADYTTVVEMEKKRIAKN